MNKEALKSQCPFVYNEMFEWNVYQLSTEELKGKTILDIGGHYGFFAMRCVELGAQQLVCLEPNLNNYINLLRNTRDISNIKAINLAVSPETGKTVCISDASELSRVGDVGFNIRTISLKDLLLILPDSDNLQLKIDVEGFEHEIFKKTDISLRNHFETIYVEIHDESLAGEGNTIESLEKHIASQGYFVAWKGGFFTEMANQYRESNTHVAVYKFKRI